MTTAPIIALALLASAAMAPSAARAAPQGKPIIVFESHVGPRPAKLEAFLDAANNLLETRGYAAYPATLLRIAGRKIPQPGVLDPALTAADLAELHTNAFAKYKAAQWSEALAALLDARDKTRRNPVLVANDISNQDMMFRTMVAIADCYKRLGDQPRAEELMRDVRRVYPTRPVSRTDSWVPHGEQLYLDVTLADRGVLRGRLTIGAGDPNAQIAVEGQFRGVGNVSLADMFHGVYRVFIRTSATDPGRQYEVQVKAGEEARLAVDINMDKLLYASTDYVAFTYPSESARRDECKLATHFAELWTESGATLVLASGEENGRPIVIGLRCRDGVQIRRAIIFTDTGEATTPEKLVPFLDDIITEGSPALTREDHPRSTRAASSYTVPAFAVGAGLLATAIGAYFELHKKPDGNAWEAPPYLVSYPGLSVRIAGGATAAAGLYLLLRHHAGARQPSGWSKGLVLTGTVVMLGTAAFHVSAPVNDHDEISSRRYTIGGYIAGSLALGAGAYGWLRETRGLSRFAAGALGGTALTASAVFMLAVDEDDGAGLLGPRAHDGVRRYYWDTGPPGLVVGGAAVVALGLGWWAASRSSTSTPIVTVGGDHAFAGWAGSF